MKTHLTILLLLLLVFAGSYDGSGQINSNKSTKSKKNNSGFQTSYQIGVLYKQGFYSGELGTNYSSYRFFKPLFLSSRRRNFYFDLGVSLIGVIDEFKRGKVQNTQVEEKFYSRAYDIFFSVGTIILTKKDFSLTTTLSISSLHHSYYTRKIGLFDKVGGINRESTYENDGKSLTQFGPGVFIDYNILKLGFDSNLIARLRYNALIATEPYSRGIVHELQIGLLINLNN